MSIPESITDLETKLLSTRNDVARIPLLLALSRKLANRDDRRAFSLAEEAYHLQIRRNRQTPEALSTLAQALNLMSLCLYRLSDYHT